MIKAHDILTFAYHITICIRDIISIASNIIFKARVTMKLSCDIMVFIQEAFHNYLNKFEIVVTHLLSVILCKG